MSLDDRDWYREDAKRRAQLPHYSPRNAARRFAVTHSHKARKRRFPLWLFVIAGAVVSELIRHFA
ncbi:hypothetical protein [Halopseudomonas sp.]|uniref:hypothetical protein n=1 Tax=Halopseudomonas sp. TaxID=2901191 RepID=UPI00311F8E09